MNNKVQSVLELYITTLDSHRVNKESISLDINGVIEDKFHNKNVQRSVLITSIDAYDIAASKGIELKYGELGENILLSGNIKDFQPSQRFKIGNVELEITQNCTICKGLSAVDANLPKLLQHDRGIFAKVISNGTIKKGDTISI
jgi:MOSC domain-containing protein YiiM